ncbi:hypothetical protein Tsubulata_045944 [Turnera subulata]|uniref:DUF4283 domain-containing protein n=1 Tax=Turnera subulata TaxID=218843 RepID=A0A9Q0G8A9_9ROSI|nr:hypothetical protein Tsubulata_045944 [Turnera subulata]
MLSTVSSASAPQSWATMAKRTPLHPLHFVHPVFNADSNVIQIPSQLLDLGRQKYSLCLIGQFMGNPPKIGLIQAMATKLWGRDGAVTAVPYKEDLYLFKFPSDSSLSRALHSGPWHIGGIPLLLRKWEVNIQPVDFSTSLIPVWVQLKHVPFELMTKEGLSYLASAIGKPLHMTQDCSTLFSTDRVNVCIEVDYSKPLLEALTIEFDGYNRTIDISYSWKPLFCDLCHHHLSCSAKQTIVQWVSKAVVVDPSKTTTQELPIPSTVDPVIPQSEICNNNLSVSSSLDIAANGPISAPSNYAAIASSSETHPLIPKCASSELFPSSIHCSTEPSDVPLVTISPGVKVISPLKTGVAAAGVQEIVHQPKPVAKPKKGHGSMEVLVIYENGA